MVYIMSVKGPYANWYLEGGKFPYLWTRKITQIYAENLQKELLFVIQESIKMIFRFWHFLFEIERK